MKRFIIRTIKQIVSPVTTMCTGGVLKILMVVALYHIIMAILDPLLQPIYQMISTWFS